MDYSKAMKQRDIERFEKYVPDAFDKDTDCITWRAAKNQYGYPVFWFDGSIHVATRIIYSLHHGVDIPDVDEDGQKVVVATTCGNRACVHVPHLYLTTREKAVSASHANGNYDHVYPVGIKHREAKLSEGAVRHIRKLYATGKYTQTQLAEMYGVTQHTISYAVRGKSWRHVE
jgi:hypothetical protein